MTIQQGAELAQAIGVDPGTLENWVDELKIPLPEKYQRNALQVLKMVKELKDKNCGFHTIRRQIQLDYPELEAQQSEDYDPFNSLRTELMQLGELAEKYAQANYNIGQMSMQMKQLESENHRLQAQLKLLPSADAWEAMQEREQTYKNLMQGLQQRIQGLEAQVRDLSGKSSSPSGSKPRYLPDLPPAKAKAPELKLPFQED